MSEYIYATNGAPLSDNEGSISLPREKIIRCRDCIHFTPKGTYKFDNGNVNTDCCIYIRGWLLQITPDFFCAWGERKSMKQCDKDKTPCLHEACLSAQNVKCCSACEFSKDCTTECFKVKGLNTNEKNSNSF